MLTKKELRVEMKRRLDGQSPQEREIRSRRIQEKLFSLDAFKKAKTISFFVALPTEVMTLPMIEAALKAGKKILVPRTDLANAALHHYEIKNISADLVPGTMGILEPRPEKTCLADPNEIDCAVVPGLLFDERYYRVGFGAGLYDRFLKLLRPGVPKIGLGYSFQKTASVPVEPHDEKLDFVLTD